MSHWKITGDFHGIIVPRLKDMRLNEGDCVIALGDVGLNFFIDDRDVKNKKNVEKFLAKGDNYLYCVRGNHEERPETLKMNWFVDTQVGGEVYMEYKYPHIRYFKDGGVYSIDGHKALVIGGAYSVDKFWRLQHYDSDWQGWTGWFADEQLTEEERAKIFEKVKGKEFDFVFTHTCPYDAEPRDLFLSVVDQSTVDDSMERWLQQVEQAIKYKVWCCGHYHADRNLKPHMEMCYKGCRDLIDEVLKNWNEYK